MTERRRILLVDVTPCVPQPITPGIWNASDKDAGTTLSGVSLIATKSASNAAWSCVRCSAQLSAGQWYWETIANFSATADVAIGVAISAAGLAVKPGSDAAGYSIAVSKDGNVRAQNTVLASVGTIPTGSRVRLWLDIDGGRLFVAVNGNPWQLCLLPAGMIGSPMLPIVGLYWPSGAIAPSATAYFGNGAFAYEVPEDAKPGAYVEPEPQAVTLHIGSEGFDYVPDFLGFPAYSRAVRYLGRISAEADVETEREGSCWVWGNQTVSRPGQIALINVDGGLDEWLTYIWRDAPITLLKGYEGDAFLDFEVWTTATVDSIAATDDGLLILRLADPLAVFDVALQPDLYPDNQPNPQAVGQPKGIVIGRPMYCEGVLLDTDPAIRNIGLHDARAGLAGASGGITSIAQIYDRGSLFKGPDDPYVAGTPITLVNGGNFTTWAADTSGVQMPQNWLRLTTFAAANDRFQQGVVAGTLRMLSSGQATTAIFHRAPAGASVLSAGYRYTIAFDVTAVGKAGQFLFRADNGTTRADVVVPVAAVGAVSVTIDVGTEATAELQLVLGRTELDVTIDNLTVSSVQIIDWTYLTVPGPTRRYGFHLANKAAGKVVANPIGPGTGGVPYERLVNVVNYVLARGWLSAGAAGFVPTVSGFTEGTRTTADYRIATYERRAKTALALLRDIMDSWCGWIVPRRDGSLAVGRVLAPARQSVPWLTLNTNNVSSGVVVSDDVAKGLTVRIAGRRCHAVHGDGDLVSTISAALRAELTTEMTIVRTGSPAISAAPVSSAYAMAVGAPAKATLLQDAADIQAEANRVATLWRQPRQFFQLSAVLDASQADALEPGQTVQLVWPRYGLENGRNLLVVGVRSRFFSRRVDLKLWG